MELGWSCRDKNRQSLENQHYLLDGPGTHKEPRKTKDEMRERLGQIQNTLAPCRAQQGPVEVTGENLRPTTDIHRLKQQQPRKNVQNRPILWVIYRLVLSISLLAFGLGPEKFACPSPKAKGKILVTRLEEGIIFKKLEAFQKRQKWLFF